MTSHLLIFLTIFSSFILSLSQPLLDPTEQQAVYTILSSLNPLIPWSTLFPSDLCLSAPHGVVCDYFFSNDNASLQMTAHITELSFGYVSDYTPNPPCSANATFSPLLFTSFKYLRKLFFYECFTQNPVFFPNITISNDNLEELVFVNNKALVGSLDGILGNFVNLRRVVLTGNGFYGEFPSGFGDLVNLEEITLSWNNLSGGVLCSFEKLRRLRVLDLGHNFLDRNVPDSVGNLPMLLKLDLGYNGFSGKIPESLVNLQNLEFLDLSFNRFGNFGVPLFLAEMPRLQEVYLSGNLLGGQIPEIWGKLGGIIGIGFSNMGLVGKIPASIGVHLKNLCYLGLDNNKLEGEVPKELGFLEFVNEVNLENNNLSGRVNFSAVFTARVGKKLRLNGNFGLCVDGDTEGFLGQHQLKLCNKSDFIANSVLFKEGGGFISSSSASLSCPCVLMIMVFGILVVFGLVG